MQEERRRTEDEMVGWHHGLDGHEFEQTPGDGEGQGGLTCCSPWGGKESDTTERLKNNNNTTNILGTCLKRIPLPRIHSVLSSLLLAGAEVKF